MFRKMFFIAVGCLVVGCSSSSSDSTRERQGELDGTFSPPQGYALFEGWNRDSYVGLAIQSDGRIVVSTGISGELGSDAGILRYHTDGTLDSSFGGAGLVLYGGGNGDDCGRSAAVDGDQRIILTGYTHNGEDMDVLVMRLNRDGSYDDSFGAGGIVTYNNSGRNDYGRGIALQPDGKIVVTARSTGEGTSQALLLRFDADGTADASFGTDGVVVYESEEGNAGFRDLTLQADGKIVVTGYTRTTAGFEILTGRYHMDGTLDGSFGQDGVARYDGENGNAGARGIALLSDGRIVVSGSNDNGTDLDVVVLVYSEDGSLDSRFGTGGVVVYDGGKGDDNGRRLRVQSGDRIVVTGNTWNGSGYDTLVLRYHADGTADTAFGTGGAAVIALEEGNGWGEAVAIQSDQNIVVAGGIDHEMDEVVVMRLIGSSRFVDE